MAEMTPPRPPGTLGPLRPRLAEHVSPRRHVVGGQQLVVLHDRRSAASARIGAREWAVLRCADGTYRWVLDGAVMLRDQQGSPREIVGAVHDITDRKELDEGIWEHEEFLDTLLESASKGLFVVDKKIKLVYVTAACQALLGLSPSDWVRDGRGLRFHPADAKRAGACFLRALNGSPGRCESRVRVADGSYVRMGIDLSPVKWRGREFVLGIINDLRPGPGRKS